jgi:hypothetical protein
MPGTTPSKNPPQAVVREGVFVRFVSLAEAGELHKKSRGRWFPKKFPVHRSDAGHTFIDKEDGTCARCRAGGDCKLVGVSAVDITPPTSAASRSERAASERAYTRQLREMLDGFPAALRMEMEKFDLGSLSAEQAEHLAQEASEVLRGCQVPWTQPDGSKITLWHNRWQMPLADVVRTWMGRAKESVQQKT